MKEKTRVIELKPIEVKYSDGNPIPSACILKRKATQEEALYILEEIVGFNLKLVFEDSGDDKDTIQTLKEEFTEALNDFLNGGDYNSLSQRCECDDGESPNFACFLWLVSYCQQNGIF